MFTNLLKLTFVIVAIIPIINCGCPDGWSNWKNKCYWNGQRSNFETNKQVCAEKNADLVSIESAEENSAILRYVNTRGRGDHWLSGKRVEIGVNKFKWGDGSDFTYTNWWPGEPSELHKENAACVIIGSDGRWWDVPCNEIRSQLCQIELDKPHEKFNLTSYLLNNTADINTRIDNNTYVIDALNNHIRLLSKDVKNMTKKIADLRVELMNEISKQSLLTLSKVNKYMNVQRSEKLVAEKNSGNTKRAFLFSIMYLCLSIHLLIF